jgi:hypothetical protein
MDSRGYPATDYAWSGGILYEPGAAVPASDPTCIHCCPLDPEEERKKENAANHRTPSKRDRAAPKLELCHRCQRPQVLKARFLCKTCYTYAARHNELESWTPMARRER